MKRSDRHGRSAPHGRGRHYGRRRRQGVVVLVALLLSLGWLAWNLLLVESDVAEVAVDAQQSGAPATP